MSFSIDYIPSNLSRLSSCFQNHMNTLAEMCIRDRVYGDLLMRCLYRVRPSEKEKGAADALAAKWSAACVASLVGRRRPFRQVCRELVRDFDTPVSYTHLRLV